jgi:hypothetical protein
MTGTEQLLGHFNRLLDLLWQMLYPCCHTPTNSTGKKPLLESITGSQAFVFAAFVFERIPPSLRRPSPRLLNSFMLNHQVDRCKTLSYGRFL